MSYSCKTKTSFCANWNRYVKAKKITMQKIYINCSLKQLSLNSKYVSTLSSPAATQAAGAKLGGIYSVIFCVTLPEVFAYDVPRSE